MVDTLKDKSGRVVAYIEWSLRNKFGLEERDGKYVYVHNIWVHDDYRKKNLIRRFINILEPKVPSFRLVYWKRSKYNGRLSMWDEKHILKLKGV